MGVIIMMMMMMMGMVCFVEVPRILRLRYVKWEESCGRVGRPGWRARHGVSGFALLCVEGVSGVVWGR